MKTRRTRKQYTDKVHVVSLNLNEFITELLNTSDTMQPPSFGNTFRS